MVIINVKNKSINNGTSFGCAQVNYTHVPDFYLGYWGSLDNQRQSRCPLSTLITSNGLRHANGPVLSPIQPLHKYGLCFEEESGIGPQGFKTWTKQGSETFLTHS